MRILRKEERTRHSSSQARELLDRGQPPSPMGADDHVVAVIVRTQPIIDLGTGTFLPDEAGLQIDDAVGTNSLRKPAKPGKKRVPGVVGWVRAGFGCHPKDTGHD